MIRVLERGARRLLDLPWERWARRWGSRRAYRWAYRRARGHHWADALFGRRPEPLYDLAVIVPEQARGWILEAIGREVAARCPGRIAFHYSSADPPPARAYFLCYYGMLPKFLRLNPSVWGSRIVVHYTHPREVPVAEDELVYSFNHATRVIPPNSAAVRRLRSLGVRPGRLEWIAAGADPGLFRAHARGGGLIGFSSAYYERKRPDRVLEIVRRLPRRRFLLLGRGWRQWERFDELSALPNLSYVEAPYEEYPAHYARMDVFVSPASLEGGPIPLLEAMMSNAVPVAAATGFAPDLIRHGENGFLFDPEAPVEDVLPLIEEACRLTADVRSSVEHLGWEAYARRVLAIAGLPLRR